MTIPIDSPRVLRGPRETLVALTEDYLRRGELGADARISVTALARRVDAGTPDWGPLASALSSMLRGEAERALRVIAEGLQQPTMPGALLRPLLGLGVRAALAAERPALARGWRARLAARAVGREAVVLASLPEPARELLLGDAPDEPARGSGGGGAPEDAPEGAPEGGWPSGPLLHLVMDAYHGDVVSLPAQVEVVASTLRGSGDHGAVGEADGALAPEGELPLLTVRVAVQRELPEPPAAHSWHVRFVGKARALDARTSDGSLVDLRWDDEGLRVVLQLPEYIEEMDVRPEALAARVTHVVVVPETPSQVAGTS